VRVAIGDHDTGVNSTGDGQLDLVSNNVKTMSVRWGNVGIGTDSPTERLDVSGKIRATSLQITTNSGSGRVLTSDASGNATWTTAGAPNTGWTLSGSTVVQTSTGNIFATGSLGL
jgi:hypothetical protein